jgi:exodeoxyribonuclease VII small subunit
MRATRENYQANNEQPPCSHAYLLRQIPGFGKFEYRAGMVISQYCKSRFFLCATMLNSTFAMASSAKKPETSFETAMERLEKIVEEMESGKMLLEDLLVRYEEGMKLVKVCQDRLAHAEQKIQIITRDHAGKTSLKDFAAAEPPIASSAADSIEEKDNDDVRLF